MEQRKVINIENFFTEENERKGVWHEPVIDDIPCGIEFLLTGIHTDEATIELTKIDEKSEKIRESTMDESEKEKLLDDLDAERVAVITKGIRAKDGSQLVKNGKPIEFSKEFAKEFYKNCPAIKMHNVDFVLKSSSFMIFE